MKLTSKSVKKDPADFAPGHLANEAERKQFEAASMPRIERNRSLLFFAASLILNLAQGFSIAAMIPLQKVQVMQPTKLEGGRVIADPNSVKPFAPDREMTGYFLNQWTKSIHEIIGVQAADQATRKAAEMAVGTAKDQLREYLNKNNPFTLLAEAPGTTREYEYQSINFMPDGNIYLRFSTTTRRPGTPPKTQFYAMTATTTTIQPATTADYMRNPTGLHVTYFSISAETTAK